MFAWLRALFTRKPVRLAIVRRYCDANGSYIGELYIEREHGNGKAYCMIGASLDSFPLDAGDIWPNELRYAIDTDHDFLVPMPPNRVRVGALEPRDNDKVRKMAARLPRGRMSVTIQNRFIEHVLEPKPAIRDNDYR